MASARLVRAVSEPRRSATRTGARRSRRDLPGRRVRQGRAVSCAVDRPVTTLTAELVADARCSVGESPVWDLRDQRLYFVDINAATIHRLEQDGSLRSWRMPEKVACIAPHAAGGWI